MLPLDGLRVVEFAVAIFGGMPGQMLADLGADVIKVEPLEGDFMRLTAARSGDGARWMAVNRNKSSIAVNLKVEQGTKIAADLIRSADVVIQNYRPGVMTRLGLDYQAARKINPSVVYASLSGYGETGPLRNWVGADLWAQALSGMMNAQGGSTADSYAPPTSASLAFVDHAAGMIAAFGILAGVMQRQKTGEGCEIAENMLDAAIFLQASHIAEYLVDGRNIHKEGRGLARSFPYGVYPTKDGEVVTLSGQDEDQWPILCAVLGLEGLMEDPRCATFELREQHKQELYPILDKAFRFRTRAEWQQAFREAQLRCDPCLDYAEVANHPQTQANGTFVEVNHPRQGVAKMPFTPIAIRGQSARPNRPSPLVGEHTREVLRKLGYSDDAITRFADEGVVALLSQ